MTARTAKQRRIATREIASVWLSDHIGRVIALTLGMLGVLGIAFLAAIGFQPALGGLVVVVFGVGLVALGGLRGRMRSH